MDYRAGIMKPVLVMDRVLVQSVLEAHLRVVAKHQDLEGKPRAMVKH